MHIQFAERHAFLLVAAAILAAGIACAAPIQPYGPGLYIVTYSSEFGAARAQSAAIRDANKYCVEKFPDSVMTPASEQTVASLRDSFALVFSCEVP
jgi:hypothetical protein